MKMILTYYVWTISEIREIREYFGTRDYGYGLIKNGIIVPVSILVS
jgi:hypothetical protein